MSKVKPITPDEVVDRKINAMPDEMLQAVNDLIAKNWNGSEASFKVEEIVSQYFIITGKRKTPTARVKLFDNHWLDIEPIYREAGWIVRFESPDYTEDFPSYFVLTMKNKK